ncbi:MAG: hypothetical protein ABIH89_06700 [Elusimicrobiota bacterium]
MKIKKGKGNKSMLYTAIAVLSAVALMLFISISTKPSEGGSEDSVSEKGPDAHPVIIAPARYSLDGFSVKDIAVLRREIVSKYNIPGIYQGGYHMSGEPENRIYRSISPDAGWTDEAEFFISNPYFLIILTYTGSSTPLAFKFNCGVEYEKNSFRETYEGNDARRWFYNLYYYEDSAGMIRINMVNAYDAGFLHAGLDAALSVNVDAEWKESGIILNGIYSQPGFYHVGRGGTNNLSPTDPRGRIKLIRKNEYTLLYIKLWREKPENISAKEDLSYIIEIAP